jgi:hypothetical protein
MESTDIYGNTKQHLNDDGTKSDYPTYFHSDGSQSDYPTHLDPEPSHARDGEELAYDVSKDFDKAQKALQQGLLDEAIYAEKTMALNILYRMIAVDPDACVAGGAPRDWMNGEKCNDIDIFYTTKTLDPSKRKAQIELAMSGLSVGSLSNKLADKMAMLGITNPELVESLDLRNVMICRDEHIEDITATEQYDNSNIMSIFEAHLFMEGKDDGDSGIIKRVQFICCNDSSPKKLFEVFDSSINCIAMSTQDCYNHRNLTPWKITKSTLNAATHLTKIIVFTEAELENRKFKDGKLGVNSNKAYQRFVVDGNYSIGNEEEVIARLVNMSHYTNDVIVAEYPETRQYENTDLPF